MFNLDDFDQVCVQAIHIESGGKPFKFSQKPSRQLEIKDSKDSKRKRNFKGKISATTRKESEIPTCTHFHRIWHDESKGWKPHLELRPKNFQKNKGEKKANAVIQQDLGSDSGYEGKITAMVLTGTTSDTCSSSSIFAPSSNINHLNEDKRVELFHIRITSKNKKIDTLFDSVS